MRFDIEEGNRKVETWNEKSNTDNSSLIKSYIPGHGPEGHLVLKLENEVGPPLLIKKLR